MSLVRHLPPRFEPIVGCIQALGPIGAEMQAAGVPVTVLGLNPGLRRPWDVARLGQFLRAARPQIVHTFLLTASLYGRLAAMLARVPIVIGTEQNIYARKRPSHAFAERLLMAGTDRVVVAADAVRDFYLRQVHADPAKIEVIHNAVDWSQLQTTRSRAEIRASLGIDAEAPVAITVGRLTEQKGHTHLLDAIAGSPALARVHLLVAGDGELREPLADQAEKLGLARRVHFLGVRRDVGNLLAASDLFVLPSLWEGLPLALVLAMGAGLPVVATRVAGVPEVVDDGRTGMLVAPGDAAALADVVTRLLAEPEKARQIGSAARAAVLPRFGIEAYVASIATLYDRLLDERAA
jgi:glycosyltransferase involved in cell wall biosynthesis